MAAGRENNRRCPSSECVSKAPSRECETHFVIVAGLSESGVPRWRSIVPCQNVEASTDDDPHLSTPLPNARVAPPDSESPGTL